MGNFNIKSSTIEKGLDLTKDFLQTIIKPSLEEIGLLMSDKVKVWRLNNQIKNLQKVQKIIQKNGISPKQISMKVMFPYLEAVAMEEDEMLQDMWANLMANYIDPARI